MAGVEFGRGWEELRWSWEGLRVELGCGWGGVWGRQGGAEVELGGAEGGDGVGLGRGGARAGAAPRAKALLEPCQCSRAGF